MVPGPVTLARGMNIPNAGMLPPPNCCGRAPAASPAALALFASPEPSCGPPAAFSAAGAPAPAWLLSKKNKETVIFILKTSAYT